MSVLKWLAAACARLKAAMARPARTYRIALYSDGELKQIVECSKEEFEAIRAGNMRWWKP